MKSLITIALFVLPTVASAEHLAPRRSEVRAPSIQKQNSLRERAPARLSLQQPAETAPAARGLDVDDVLTKVNGVYMAGLQRCYRKTLAFDPTVSGKVDLNFKVGADGKVTSALKGNGIERCLSGLMSTWRFGVALDDTGTPVESSFRISLMLQRS